MTPPLAIIILAAIIGFALNPFICWLWARALDFIAAHRPAVWSYKTICKDCRNAPEQREIHFRQRKPRTRRAGYDFPVPDALKKQPMQRTER